MFFLIKATKHQILTRNKSSKYPTKVFPPDGNNPGENFPPFSDRLINNTINNQQTRHVAGFYRRDKRRTFAQHTSTLHIIIVRINGVN